MAALINAILFSNSDDEDFLYINRERAIYIRTDLYNKFDEISFIQRFRLSKASALNILSEIEYKLEYSSDRNASLAPINQLLLTLRYYASASFCRGLADFAGVSKSTANRVVHKVSIALCLLRDRFITFPSTDEEIKAAQLMNYTVASFRKVHLQ